MADCEILIEKIIVKIKIWGSRNVFYVVSAVLVNAVFFNLFFCWVFIFVISKVVDDYILVQSIIFFFFTYIRKNLFEKIFNSNIFEKIYSIKYVLGV